MKFWLEAELEHDEQVNCDNCEHFVKAPQHCWYELNLVAAALPNPDELHTLLTGKKYCGECACKLLV